LEFNVKSFSALLFAILLNVAIPIFPQPPSVHGQTTPRANEGHIPPPPGRSGSSYGSIGSMVQHLGDGRLSNTQHVDHDQWYGHDRPDDRRFDLDHPFEHGHLEHIGPSYRYSILRIDRDHHRFWFPGGSYFEVAAWDWPVFVDWCWDCGDDFVVYEDPDHNGWYLLYNIHTGLYVHVLYLGT
jgi:hypothetical protein